MSFTSPLFKSCWENHLHFVSENIVSGFFLQYQVVYIKIKINVLLSFINKTLLCLCFQFNESLFYDYCL